MTRLKPLWLDLAPMADRLRRAPRLLVAVDFDGTLTPLVGHPDLVRLAPRTRHVLAGLSRFQDVEVAVLSGRRLADLKRQLTLRGVYLGGCAGIETQAPGAPIEVHMPRARALPAELGNEARAWCRRFERAWLEDKRHILALHYRNVPPRFQSAFAAGVTRLWRPYRSRVALFHGKKVVELVPAVPWNKATALQHWWAPRRRDLVVCFGDDANDEPLHAYVRKHGGVSVTVGRSKSRAEFRVSTPDEVTWALEWLFHEWQERGPAKRAATWPKRTRR